MREEKTFCNMCGKEFDMWDLQEGFGFNYNVGYGSTHDEEKIVLDLCCGCFDKLMEYIVPLCKHNPIKDMG